MPQWQRQTSGGVLATSGQQQPIMTARAQAGRLGMHGSVLPLPIAAA